MIGGKSRNGLALAALLQCSSVGLAQTTPLAPSQSAHAFQSAPEPEAQSLAIARQIAAIALTKDKTDAFVKRAEYLVLETTINKWLNGVQINDPELAAIIQEYYNRATPVIHAALLKKLPELNESTAHAYARLFSRTELSTILDFARTPAGAKFLARAVVVNKEDELTRSSIDIEFAALESQQQLQIELNSKLQTYLANHPDIASMLREAAALRQRTDSDAELSPDAFQK